MGLTRSSIFPVGLMWKITAWGETRKANTKLLHESSKNLPLEWKQYIFMLICQLYGATNEIITNAQVPRIALHINRVNCIEATIYWLLN
jgi:hypothetical protein